MNMRAPASACAGSFRFTVLVAAVGIGIASGQKRSDVKVSQPFRYEGYTSAAWKGYRRTSEFVRMQDGVNLAVDIVLPTEFQGSGLALTRFPVIFRYTPYGRSTI